MVASLVVACCGVISHSVQRRAMAVLSNSGPIEHDSVSVAEKAAALRGWLLEEAPRIEAEKRIPGDVAQRLAEADLFRMTQPPRFGGLGCTPRQAWEAVFQIAGGCASCSWVVGLNAANVLMLGKFSAKVQEEVFNGNGPAIISMLTG